MAARGKQCQLDHMYTADFETCDDITAEKLYGIDEDDEEEIEIYPQRVWLAGLKNLDSMEEEYHTSIDDFMRRILARGDNQNIEIAFHNLRFDGSFIVPWLLRNGYIASEGKPKDKEFSILIDQMNNWYTINIQVTKRRRVLIWDSQKLFPMPLKKVHKVYGTPTKKLYEPSEFYTEIRPVGHVPTEEELRYFSNDLTVLAEALRAHINIYGLTFKKTQASQSFYEFEKSFPAWKLRFPPLSEEIDEYIRPAYWGGLSYVNKQHQGKDHYKIGVYDINSSYPYQQAYKKLPYGPPRDIWENQPPDSSKFWIATAIVEFELKPGKVPCIPKKAIEESDLDMAAEDKWLHSSLGSCVMKFCSIDYMTMRESYNIKVRRWIKVVHFAWKIHPEIQKFILRNNDIKVKYKKMAKEETDEELINQYLITSNRAKINNNSYYGKFGEDIVKEGKTPYLIDDDVLYIQDRHEVLKEGKRKYLPVAIATTAWGRHQLVTFANTLKDSFLYCDTDSIHFLEEKGLAIIKAAEEKGTFKISSTELGAWKYEGHFDRGRYLRAKCYFEQNYKDKYPEVTLAGLPADPILEHDTDSHINYDKRRTCCTWENFHIGLVIKGGNGKLRSVRTPTGNKLIPTDFVINEKEFIFGY